jgi:hypothetical protein
MRIELGCNVMKETEYILSSQTNVVLTKGNYVMVTCEELNMYNRISDAIDEASHKPMSLQPGSTV